MLVIFLLMLIPFFLITAWTQDELDYFMAFVVHHSVHIPYILVMVITAIANGAAVVFDLIICILRISGVF